MEICEPVFFFFLNWGHLWLLVDRWCFAVEFLLLAGDESYLYSTSQYSVIHHMFFVQSCTRRPISSTSLSQSKFPITSGGSSFSSSLIAGFLWSKFFQPSLPPKMLKVPLHPHPPVIFSYQSMKLLQESTLQGCHKRDSFDHSCTLRRVYISIILLQ